MQILDVKPGNVSVAKGERLAVSAEIHGVRRNEPVRLRYSTADQSLVDETIPMTRPADGVRFEAQLPRASAGAASGGVLQDLAYWIEAGDARTEKFKVAVFERPTMVVDRVRYEFPAYTGMPSAEAASTGDVRGIEGTRVTIEGIANQPIKTAFIDFEADGKNKRWEYQGSFDISDRITAIFGAENERSNFRSRSPSASPATPLPDFVRGKAEITSAYGQLSVEPIDGLTLNGGVRYDDHDRYGGQTLFAAGGVWRLASGTVLRASYGEGFKAPSLYQLFSEYGNVGLDPEEAHGWEAGIEQHLFDRRLVVGATWFDRTTTNQIIFNSCSFPTSTDPLCTVPGDPATPRFGYYLNVARSEAHGVEAAAALTLGGLTLDGNYSWIAAEDRSEGTANFGNWLPRRPRHSANASASYAFGFGLELGAALRWSGKSYDNASNAQRLDDYTLVDLRAEYALSDAVKLFARAENIFDEGYMTAFRYGAIGRSFYAGIRGRF